MTYCIPPNQKKWKKNIMGQSRWFWRVLTIFRPAFWLNFREDWALLIIKSDHTRLNFFGIYTNKEVMESKFQISMPLCLCRRGWAFCGLGWPPTWKYQYNVPTPPIFHTFTVMLAHNFQLLDVICKLVQYLLVMIVK